MYGDAFLENMATAQLVRKFSVFYGTQRFVIEFTTAPYMKPSWASWLIFIPLNSVSRTILILWRTDPLLSDDSVNSGCGYIAPATYTHATELCNRFLSNGSVNTFPRKRTRSQQYKSGLFYVARAATVAVRPLLCNGVVNTPPQQQRGCVFCVARAEELS
jgi:hypothetical protein